MRKNFGLVAVSLLFLLSACATGGQTTTGNAGGGTVTVSPEVGDVCLGQTANCTQKEKEAAEKAAAAAPVTPAPATPAPATPATP